MYFFESTVIGLLKNLLFFLKFCDGLSALLILLLQSQLCEHAVLLLLIEAFEFCLLFVHREAQQSEGVHE